MSYERTITKIVLALPTRTEVTERHIAIAKARRRAAMRRVVKLKEKGMSSNDRESVCK